MIEKIVEPNRTLAQHFTPRYLVDFGWTLLREFGPDDISRFRIIDPAAGAGVWLDPVFNGEQKFVGEGFGIDIDRRWSGVGEVRHIGDALWSNFPGVENSTFDVVVGNPPFGRLNRFLPLMGLTEKKLESSRFEVIKKLEKNRRNLTIELLFLERAIQLAKPGGWIIQVLPDSLFSNAVYQKARDWFLGKMHLFCIVDLPNTIFRNNYLNVRTCILVARRSCGNKRLGRNRVRMFGHRETVKRKNLGAFFKDVLQFREKKTSRFNVRPSSLSGRRWDPSYWSGVKMLDDLQSNFEMMPLGDFVEHLTYGPIVTGRKMQHVDHGRPVILQGDIAETGLLHRQLIRVEFDGEYDPERSRVRRGDFLMARSGVGSLGKNRMVVYTGRETANVGCFVDLLRLVDLNPFSVWFFFKTIHGRSQILSVINGVGTPNINFSEIRSLLIPNLKPETQIELENKYRREVLPLHRRQSSKAKIKFAMIIKQFELFLSGKISERKLIV